MSQRLPRAERRRRQREREFEWLQAEPAGVDVLVDAMDKARAAVADWINAQTNMHPTPKPPHE